jgi:indolepyruvate ferredoxin oxidoreductase, beta subunit
METVEVLSMVQCGLKNADLTWQNKEKNMNNKNIIKDTNRTVVNIVMSGVGGQGVLVASDVLVAVAMLAGLDSKKSEVHGMAQRGGSVVSQIRYGEKIYSPLIEHGCADIILAFEKLEAVRYLDFLKPGGIIIINNQQITPLTVFFADIPYPKDVADICRKKTDKIIKIDGIRITEELGNPRILNTIMLGALSKYLQFEEKYWLKAIEGRVPAKTFELNKKAFAACR